MPQEHATPTLEIDRYQTFDGQPVILLYRIREHRYGHFADQDLNWNIERWNQDGTHVENPDWNLKILELDD